MNDDDLLRTTAAPPPERMSDMDLLRETARGGAPVTDADKTWIKDTSVGRILDAAGEGAKHGWGARPLGLSPDTQHALTGLSGDMVRDALTSPFRAFNSAFVVPAITVLDGAMRMFGGAAGAVAAGTGQTAKEAGMNEADANRLSRDLLLAAETTGMVAGVLPFVPQTRAARAAKQAEPPPAKLVSPAVETPVPPKMAAMDDALTEVGSTPLADRVRAGETVEAVAADVARASPETPRVPMSDIDARVVTFAETEATARAMGISFDEALKMKLVEGKLAAENLGIRQVFIESSSRVHKLKDAARGGNADDKAAFLAEVESHLSLLPVAQNRSAESGRTLNAMKIMKEQSDKAKATAQILKDFGGQKNVDELIAALDRLETPEQVAMFLRNAEKANWKDMALEAWRATLLSGPITQIRNIVGNTLNLVITVPESAIAGGIGAARRAFGGEGGVRIGEAAQRTFGIASAVPDAVRNWGRAIADENYTAGMVSQVEAVHPRAIPGTTGKVVRVPFRTLNAFDQSFRTLAYEAEVRALALRQAADEGLSGQRLTNRVADLIRDPTPEMRAAGQAEMLRATFQTPLSGFMARLDAARRSRAEAQFIVPFLRTPTNIMRESLVERTPLGLLSKEVRANLSGRNGAAARDTQMARLTMGALVGYTFFQLAEKGLITGTAPKDANERAMMILAGKPPMSVKIGDTWYEYTSGDPMSTLMALAADAQKIWTAATTDQQDKIAGMVGMAISRQVLDKSWARGPSDLLDAVTDPTRYGDKWVQGQVAAIAVPSIVRQTATTMDPVMRDVRSVLDAIKAATPGLSEDLPAQRDIFGNVRRRPEKLGPDMASPFPMARESADPVVQELSRLKVYPALPGREFMGTKLEPKQYEQLAILTGIAVRGAIEPWVGIFRDSDLTDVPIPDGARREIITSAVNKAREQARKAFAAENPEFLIEAMRQQLDLFD